jgi:hypothetical protein
MSDSTFYKVKMQCNDLATSNLPMCNDIAVISLIARHVFRSDRPPANHVVRQH